MLISELRVVENGGYRLQWYFPEEDEWGAYLGEGDYWRRDPSECTDAEKEIKAACDAVKGLAKYCSHHNGFVFDAIITAKRALRMADAAMRAFHQDTSRYPEWAKVALAAGWKAPKGWKP